MAVSTPVTVYALRKDGFTNEIDLILKDAPPGFAVTGSKVPANQNQVRFTLTASPAAGGRPVPISLEGRATIDGCEVLRPVVPAEDMMQAFAYRHLVPAKELDVAVLGLGNGRFMGRSWVRVLGESPVRIPAGGTARVRLGTPTSAFAGRFDLELNDPPEGIAIDRVLPTDEGAEIVLKGDAAKLKPGLRGNLIVNLLAGRNMPAAQKGKKQGNQRRAMGTLPAIPFEVVASP